MILNIRSFIATHTWNDELKFKNEVEINYILGMTQRFKFDLPIFGNKMVRRFEASEYFFKQLAMRVLAIKVINFL